MSAGYLLDTNICVHFLRGENRLNEKLAAIGLAQCFVSEITIAELLFGAANSAPAWQARQHQQVAEFRELFAAQVLPVAPALEIFADQKAALRRSGQSMILIFSSAARRRPTASPSSRATPATSPAWPTCRWKTGLTTRKPPARCARR